MQLSPYLTFNGNCEEAMNFYKDCLGGEFEGPINYFKDGPEDMDVSEQLGNRVMHASLRFGDGVLMASDSMQDVVFGGNVSLSIQMDNVEKMTKVFNKLSAGGEVTMPLQDTFWGAHFGMCTDKFGMQWMFNCQTSSVAAN